jgi:hypothetical protein
MMAPLHRPIFFTIAHHHDLDLWMGTSYSSCHNNVPKYGAAVSKGPQRDAARGLASIRPPMPLITWREEPQEMAVGLHSANPLAPHGSFQLERISDNQYKKQEDPWGKTCGKLQQVKNRHTRHQPGPSLNHSEGRIDQWPVQ